MKWLLLIVTFVAGIYGKEIKESKETGIAVVSLSSNNFTSYIQRSRFTLVMFYAPWCSHSQTFSPQFDEIAATIQDRSISFAKVDCVADESIYNEQQIERLGGFPSLKAYMNGEVNDGIHYNGERDTQEILSFVRKYSTQSFVDLDAEEKPLDNFIAETVTSATGGAAAAVLFVEDPLPTSGIAAINAFDSACKKAGLQQTCAVAKNRESKTTYLAMYRNFPDEDSRVTLDGVVKAGESHSISSDEMMQFLTTAGYPNLVYFQEENDPLMFSEHRPGFNTHIIFILDAAATAAAAVTPADVEKQQLFMTSIRALAATYKTRAVFIHLNTADHSPYVTQILADVNVSSVDAPTVMIIKSAETKVQFYKFDPEPSPAESSPPPTAAGGVQKTVLDMNSVATWIESFFAGSLIPARTALLEPYF